MEVEKSAEYYLSGAILLIDKPYGRTSFDVVRRVRSIIRKKYRLSNIKVGHAGTLDPLATGLLVLCTGKATRQIELLMGQDKVYTGRGKLGYTTPSYDRETEEEATDVPISGNCDRLMATARNFEGEIGQVPPVYSAVKINGKRAYQLARMGEEPRVKPRLVRIDAFQITSFAPPFFDFRVVCSKGTYIRSLIHDYGQALGCGAYLYDLRREMSGAFSVDMAWKFEELEDKL